VTRLLQSLAAHTIALLLYPGLLTLGAFGVGLELVWTAVVRRSTVLPNVRLRRPPVVQVVVGLLAILAAVQLSAPLNPVPPVERNLIIAAVAIGFTAWAELALDPELVAHPGLLVVIQACWILAVLGPAVEPQTLRPQVLGTVLVPALLPVKIASGFLYLLCLPALLRLWPAPPPADRRALPRFNATRALVWFPYCALFTTIFFAPSGGDVLGVARFLGITTGVAILCLLAGLLLARRGAEKVQGLYSRAVTPYAVLVLALVIGTLLLTR
jgi:hypothetical protein